MVVDKSNEKVRDMFGEIAPKYDRMNHLLSMNVDRYWRWKTVRKVAPVFSHDCQPILDVCTGTGDLALAYSNKVKQKIDVVGADFCHEMLEVAKVKQKKQKISDDQLVFVEADAQKLPFSDNSFQIVSVAFGLRNVADTMQGLKEMTRVCAPGGKVAVLEFSMPRRQPVKGFYKWYFKNILPRIGRMFAKNKADAYQYLPDTVSEFPSYQELADMMVQAGLKESKFYPLNFGIATLYVGVKWSHPVVIAITGASGAVYATRLLEVLVSQQIDVHLTISSSGAQVIQQELGLKIDLGNFQLDQLLPGYDSATEVTYHQQHDFMTPIASGSFRTSGMVVVPCSGSTLAGIAVGTSNNLIQRAADVHLKERRKLILVPREAPLSLVHIDNMRKATEAGAVIVPASPGWYHGVKTLDDLVNFIVARILDQLGFDNDLIKRWGEDNHGTH